MSLGEEGMGDVIWGEVRAGCHGCLWRRWIGAKECFGEFTPLENNPAEIFIIST